MVTLPISTKKMEESTAILNLLQEIKLEVKSLRESTNKNHDDLKLEFSTFKTNILTQVHALDKAIKITNTKHSDLEVEVQNISKSQTFISQQYDSLKTMEKNIMISYIKLEKENEVINNKLVEISAKIKTNATNTINQEQYTRRTMVEVNNIPKQESEKENSLDIIYKLLDLLKLNLDRKTIDVAHRLSDKPDSPIIVKITTRSARDLFFNNRSRLANHTIADLGCNIDPNKKSKKIFINESLSHSIKVLFKEVRNQCEKKNYSYAWTRNGVIFIRKNKDSQAIRINSEDDFSRKIR